MVAVGNPPAKFEIRNSKTPARMPDAWSAAPYAVILSERSESKNPLKEEERAFIGGLSGDLRGFFGSVASLPRSE